MVACPLCKNSDTKLLTTVQESDYLSCPNCHIVFKDPSHYVSAAQEKERYLEHNNDVTDLRYQSFVSPIVEAVTKDFPSGSYGLDFGAGTGPVISVMLSKLNYTLELYDPFFHQDNRVLENTYHFIVCCEVMEHFHHPAKEFALLRKMLRKNGALYCMTELLPKDTAFIDWYYKDDPTHVVFYSEESLAWIREHIGFSEVIVNGRCITFRR